MNLNYLPIPEFYSRENVKNIWSVPYQQRASEAREWANQHDILPASSDKFRTCLITIDLQNSFCTPGFELFVGGPSGNGAVEDSQRLCEFIYRNLGWITHIAATLDTHQAMQIFHSVFLVNQEGEHPPALTLISREDLEEMRWKITPQIANKLGLSPEEGQRYLIHYATQLQQNQKYDLTIWPYHVMQGSIGHALVPAIEEAIFFHDIARYDQINFMAKGSNPFTEHYSAIGPEVLLNHKGQVIDRKSEQIIELVRYYDRLIIAGQAKSHCVASTIDDLIHQIQAENEQLAKKLYLLEDCTSPVVIPGVADYTQSADLAFKGFAKAGIHLVKSTQPVGEWPDFLP